MKLSFHPAPGRRRVRPTLLLFAIVGAPIAWLTQTIVNMAIARHACFPKDMPLVSPAFLYAPAVLSFVTGLALLIAVVALAAAVYAWLCTRREATGNGHVLVEIGEGRTRFMAMCAIILSIGFTIAIGFSISALVVVPLC